MGQMSGNDGVLSTHLNSEVVSKQSTEWTRTDSQMLQVLANTLAEQNKPEKAADLLEYVAGKDPQNVEALKALSAVYLLLKRFEKALAAVERVERLGEGMSRDVALVKSQALWELGREAEASQVLNAYLKDGTLE